MSSDSIDYNPGDIIKKEARGLGEADLGEVQEISGEYIITQRGNVDKDKFYIPKNLLERFDGDTVYLRVTDEESPISFVNPKDELLNYPNQITQKDFEDWIQERGLYFPENIDSRYQTILTMNDKGEDHLNSGIIYANYGKGVFIYTSISFFRQIPAGVPGAYRLFINLISAGKHSG